MRFYHRHAYAFPILLGALTVALVLLVWQTVTPSTQEGYTVLTEVKEPVTVADYEQSLQGVMDGFTMTYTTKSIEADRRVYAEEVLQQVLDLRVPTERKDVHLQIVFGLNNLCQEDGEIQASGLEQLYEIFAANPWIDSTTK